MSTHTTRPMSQALVAVKKHLVWVVIAILVIWTVLPFIWTVSSSFKSTMEVYRVPPTLIPRDFSLHGYQGAVGFEGFWRYWFNTIFIAGSTTILVLFIGVLGAYGFARHAFWLRGPLLLCILVPRILPRAGLIVPLYVRFAEMGLINTYAALIIAYVASGVPLATWIITGAFGAVPKDLEDAAKMDGASMWKHLWHVYIPIALPGVITAATLTAVDAWNEFPFVLAFTTGPQVRTLPYVLYMLRATEGIEDWPLVNAFVVLTIIPIIIAYLRLEKHVVKGMTAGALK